MAEIQPFAGVRYAVGDDVSAVVAPPYDVITDEQSAALHHASGQNIIRVTLGRTASTDTNENNRYTRARDALETWLADGTLVPEEAPAIYIYDQLFAVDGVEYVRRGFLAAVKLERFGEGSIHPHEKTLPGPKKDRLELMRTTGFNTSPIFGLFSDNDSAVRDALNNATDREPDALATEPDGVGHRMWAVTDTALIERLQQALAPRSLYIADGHHRYETAVAFRDELREAGRQVPGAEHVMMMLVPAEDPGMIVLPTHRCVYGLDGFDADTLLQRVQEHFDVVDATREAVVDIAKQEGRGPAVIGVVAGGKYRLLTLKDTGAMDQRAPDHKASWRQLDVAALHLLILEDILGIDEEALARYTNVKYLRNAADAVGRAETGADGIQAAFILRPTPMEAIMAVSEDGERLPQKTTYFYPKLLSGLVMRRIID
jgi:uncharacterized protein (DUF1015 family)